MNKTQAIVFFGIIVIGVISSIFFLSQNGSTPPKTTSQPALKAAQTSKASKPATTSAPASQTVKTDPKSKAKTQKKNAPTKTLTKFTSEKTLMGALSHAIQNKPIEAFIKLLGPDALSPTAKDRLLKLLKHGNLKLDPKLPLSAIGRTQNSTRWALRLRSPAGELIEIFTDLGKNPSGNWEVIKLHLPHPSGSSMANTNTASPNQPTTGSSDHDAKPDPMMIAYAFSKAAIELDIKTARSLTDPQSLNNQKLAALLIALEEGAFRLKKDKALVITLNRDHLSWAITRVESPSAKSEFGLEMKQSAEGDWIIAGLTFSKLITQTAMAAGAGNVAYTPIRKNPKGGDSLVLYFEFDHQQVSARTRKQLNIVAAILGEDPQRKLHINGHADAKGDDDYNVALSRRRSEAVKNTLIELGVRPGQIVTKAFGEAKPLKPNFKSDGSDNPSGRAINRRTEIYLDF
ncbi:MAG: OmpA family protein [Verrucomicrobiales bacterium]|nr:OmpA family protein [Verrucomicrobiales bacterium]